MKRNKSIRWEFYWGCCGICWFAINETWKNHSMKGCAPNLYFSFDCAETTNRTSCTVCCMGKMTTFQVLELPRVWSEKRKISTRNKHLAKCVHENFIIVAHSVISIESKVSQLHFFSRSTYLEISCNPMRKGVFTKIIRNENSFVLVKKYCY